MNHYKIYYSVIEKAKFGNRKKLTKKNLNYVYYEKHHIIPRCVGGNSNKDNLVLLTAKEHYVCHKLLTYIYKENRKIACAFYRMTFDKKGKHNISSLDYKYAKEIFHSIPRKSNYDIWKEKYGEEEAKIRLEISKQKMKGPKSKEHKNNLKGKNVGKRHTIEQNVNHNNKIRGKEHSISIETRQKISESNIGKKRSEETKQKLSISHLGLKQTEETKRNKNEKLIGLKRSEKTKQKMRKPKSEEHKQNIKNNHYKNKNKNINL